MTDIFRDSILDALRKGLSVDDLAKQMADALNAANDTYKKEQEKEDATEKARTKFYDAFIDQINMSIDTETIQLTDAAALATIAIMRAHKEVTAEQADRLYKLIKDLLIAHEKMFLWATDETKGVDEKPDISSYFTFEEGGTDRQKKQEVKKSAPKVIEVKDKDASAVMAFLKDMGLLN